MSIQGITNLNQHVAMMAKQSKAQNKPDTIHEPAETNGKTDTFKADSYESSKMDLATRKALAKGPLDEAEMQRRIEDREKMSKVNIEDVRKSMIASRPHADSVQRDIENAAKYGPIQSKMLSGKLLTAEEKSFLREHYPELYAKAIQVEEEVQRLKNDMKNAKTKTDADNIFIQRKNMLLSNNKNDSSSLFLLPALNEAYTNL